MTSSYSRRSINAIDSILNSEDSEYFQYRIIRNCKADDGQDTFELAERLKNSTRNKNNRLEALILIVYQVRCNLFHGNKMFDSEDDQEVVGMAANVLQKVLPYWID